MTRREPRSEELDWTRYLKLFPQRKGVIWPVLKKVGADEETKAVWREDNNFIPGKKKKTHARRKMQLTSLSMLHLLSEPVT